jgi:hypothetical protein
MDLHLPIDPTVSDSAADFVETTEQIRRELDRAEQDG